MELKEQVCSYEQAEKLYKLGIKHTPMAYYDRRNEEVVFMGIYDYPQNDGFKIPAYTVAELMDMLPFKIPKKHGEKLNGLSYWLNTRKTKDVYIVNYTDSNGTDLHCTVRNDYYFALSEMLIWLIENNHLKIDNH